MVKKMTVTVIFFTIVWSYVCNLLGYSPYYGPIIFSYYHFYGPYYFLDHSMVLCVQYCWDVRNP